MKRVKYKCKENDAEITIYSEDGNIDEIHIGCIDMAGRTVIGFKDMVAALKKAAKKNKNKDIMESFLSTKELWCLPAEFEKKIFDIINIYADAGLSKPDLVKKMRWITRSCEMG